MRWRKLGVIAGGGALPERVLTANSSSGRQIFTVRLAGMAADTLARFPGIDCGLGEAGKIIRSLRQAECDAVLLAGHVQRPNFSDLKTDWRGVALLPKVIAAAAKGDGEILSVLVESLEAEGFVVIGVEEAVQDLLAPAGALTASQPESSHFEDMRKGASVLAALGPFDVGQGVVVSKGYVLAIEAAEGTDRMLDRCANLPNAFAKGGVLLKRPKPGQEMRVDLPVIGVRTLEHAARAGLSGIFVEANASLVIDLKEVVREAERLDMFVYGVTAQDLLLSS